MSNLQLFIAAVAIWGSTWLAITYQLGKVAPEASVFYRFLLASVLLFAYCIARRLPLRYSLREHLWIAFFGVLMFSVSYIFVYYAEEHVVSGLVAVGYSASPMLGMIGMRVFFGTPMTRSLIAGSILGMVGISLVFWPEFTRLQGNRDTALGALYTVIAVLVSAVGSIVAQRNQRAELPLWQGMAWGMLYGAIFSLAVALIAGKPLEFEATVPYVLSLLYLSILGSVLAFAAYLTLLHRIGAARAGYIGVMVPIVALVISAAFEGFRWHALTWAGIAVSVAGNVIVLRRR
ncbi:MAG: EamA family transporter [Burkholderiales bacterium]|nr:EamA family transporter [Burkholderiales bacterium]